MALLLMLVAAVGAQWSINFSANVANTSVVTVTECKGKVPFFAYDQVPITEDGQEHITMRRQPTPHGVRCTVLVSVMRATDDDPNHDFIGESVIILQED